MFPAIAAAQYGTPTTPEPYKFVSAQEVQGDIAAEKARSAASGNTANKTLFLCKTVNSVLTTETAFADAEFEWHECRDHIFYVYEGWTMPEIGGTPVNPRKTRPGEWLAPSSDGATKVTINQGDLLLIPRGTPHKQTTGTATFMLIAPRDKPPET